MGRGGIAKCYLLEHQLHEMDLYPNDFMGKEPMQELLKRLNYATEDELLSAIGYGELTPMVVANRLTEKYRHDKEAAEQHEREAAILSQNKKVTTVSKTKKVSPGAKPNKGGSGEGVIIEGVDNLLVHLAKCCSPVPGDPIVGYVTKGRGVTIHRADCPNVTNNPQEASRLIDVSWQQKSDNTQSFNADLEIYGFNRNGLLNKVLQVLNAQTKNLNNINGRVDHDKMADIHVTVGISNLALLDRMIEAIKNIPDVYEVKRSNG